MARKPRGTGAANYQARTLASGFGASPAFNKRFKGGRIGLKSGSGGRRESKSR